MRGFLKQLIILAAVLAMAGCSKEEDPEPVEITAADFHGEWAITSFKLAGEDNTLYYSDYSFEILFGGDFIINKGGAYDGEFSSFGSFEVEEASKVLTVNIANPKPNTDYIDGTWQVYSKSDQSITLKSFGQSEKKGLCAHPVVKRRGKVYPGHRSFV